MTDDDAIAHLTLRGWLVLPRQPTQELAYALGRAWASMYGKLELFDADADSRDGYISDADELWLRAWELSPPSSAREKPNQTAT